MPEYVYRAANTTGAVVDGRLDAAGHEAALRQLRAQGLTPLKVEEAGAASPARLKAAKGVKEARSKRRLFDRDTGPGHLEVHNFTNEMSIMLRAGLPLDRALRVQIGMAGKASFKALLEDIFKSVKGGKGLSQALTPHQELFGEFYINMVRSGEAGGQLSEVLSRLAEHLERVKAMRESVISALIYPAILVVVALLSVFLMLGFVVPQFEALFDDMGEALPLPTRIIVSAGQFVTEWGVMLVLVVVGLSWLLRRWLRSPSGRTWRDERLVALPIFGSIVRKYEVTRFARSLGTLLGSGVPIVMAIRIATETMSNKGMRDSVTEVAPSVKQGGRLADALEEAGLFSALGLNMVRLGEETGRLDTMLLELARVYDGEVQAGVKRALTLVEPLLIIVLGMMIAGIIVSILMGILSVNDLAI